MKKRFLLIVLSLFACLCTFFFAGCNSCKDGHSYGDWTVTTPATCSRPGVRSRTCTVCDAVYTEPISATGIHNYGEWTITTPATCGANGARSHTCIECNDVQTEVINAGGPHTYGEWTVTAPADCINNGSRTHTCDICGNVETEDILATGSHTYGEWSITTPATCGAKGEKSRTCSACLEVEKEDIPATGVHTYVSGVCSVCSALEGEHTYVEGVCTKCGQPKPLTWREILASYDNEQKMFIGAWDNPRHLRSAYEYAANMGITHIFLWSGDGAAFVPGDTVGTGSADMETLQTWFTELGLKVIVQTGWSSGSAGSFDPRLVNYSCIDGINIFDEPIMTQMDGLKQAIKEFDEEYGDRFLCFTNLWPSSGTAAIGDTYNNYVAAHKQNMLQITNGKRVVSADVYPLLDRGDSLCLDGSWLENMYILRKMADETEADFHMFIQSVGYTLHRRPTTGEEIRFQVWTDMCFGIKGFTYFTYAGNGTNNSWQYTPAIVSGTTGEPHIQSYYDGCAQVNKEVQDLSPVYMSFDWEGLMVSLGSASSEIDAALFSLREYESEPAFVKDFDSQYGALCGLFKDEDGRDGMVITNYTDPALSLTNNVEVTFNNYNSILVYRQGEWSMERLINGVFEVTLESGEGIFVIPCNL